MTEASAGNSSPTAVSGPPDATSAPAQPPVRAAGRSASVDAPVAAQRWPLIAAFFTTWICPATTARRLAQVGLVGAFAVHIVSGVLLFVAFTILIAIALEEPPRKLWGDLIDQAVQRPREFLLVTATVFAVVELGALVLALLAAPWGAREERLPSSFRSALWTVWLQSAHVAVATFLPFWLLSVLQRTMTDLLSRAYQGPVGEPPWYIRHMGELFALAAAALSAWALWGVLRAVGARPIRRPEHSEPTCQRCGYNLSGTAAEGLCPECGEPVPASLGPEARPGVLWEQAGVSRRWRRTSWKAIREPYQLGRKMRIYTPPGAHRRFLFLHMLAGAAIGTVGSCFWFVGFTCSGRWQPFLDANFLWLIAPMSAFWTGVSVLGISLLFAVIVGLAFSLGSGRNLLPAAMRSACYVAGFLTIWTAANVPAAFFYGLSSDIDLLDAVGRWLRTDDESVAILMLIAYNLVWLCVYLRLLQIVVRGARHADR